MMNIKMMEIEMIYIEIILCLILVAITLRVWIAKLDDYDNRITEEVKTIQEQIKEDPLSIEIDEAVAKYRKGKPAFQLTHPDYELSDDKYAYYRHDLLPENVEKFWCKNVGNTTGLHPTGQ